MVIHSMHSENALEELSEFCAPGTSYHQQWIALSGRVALRVVSFYPKSAAQPFPVVMVPGLVSVMLTFKNILIKLTRHFVVHYVETREKSSSRISIDASFDVNAIGLDIVEVVSRLGLQEGQYILFGASLGATAIIEGYRHLSQLPFCLVLLEPNAVFDYPKWSLKVIRVGAPFYSILKPIAKWYLRKFRMNTEEDYEMYRISSRALDAADPYKLRDAILAISSYQIWDRLSSIHSPSLVVCASKDKFHRADDIARIVSMIPDCSYCDLEVHERTHGKEFGEYFKNYVDHLISSRRLE